MDAEIRELMLTLFKSQNKLHEQVSELAKTVDVYVKYSHERMVIMEKQLDAIFKSLTIKPTNGDSK